MIRWTTPTLTCTIPEIVFDYLILTITDEKCNAINKRISSEAVIENQFDVTLTEEETKMFPSGTKVFAQINFIWGDKRLATNIIPITVMKNLYNKGMIDDD